MKKPAFFTLLALFLCLGLPPAGAEMPKPTLSNPDTVAMAFFKLARQMPDFENWARRTEAYKQSVAADKMLVLLKEKEKLQAAFTLLILQEPLVTEMPVKLSPYSAANRGFFIRDFKADTFFPALYNDRAYAIIPQGLADHQWLKVEDASMAQAIEAANKNPDALPLRMIFFLVPKYADGKAPVTLDGKDHWLIAADIDKILLYTPDLQTLLWQSEDPPPAPGDDQMQKLLNLRQ